MKETPRTHHRAVSLLVVVLAALGLAKVGVAPRPYVPPVVVVDAGPLQVDPNTATPHELEALPGVGPAMARRIVTARTERPFTRLEDLRRVRGIGPRTLDRLSPFVVFRGRAESGTPPSR